MQVTSVARSTSTSTWCGVCLRGKGARGHTACGCTNAAAPEQGREGQRLATQQAQMLSAELLLGACPRFALRSLACAPALQLNRRWPSKPADHGTEQRLLFFLCLECARAAMCQSSSARPCLLCAVEEALDPASEQIMMLNNGCLCCTVRDDLVDMLEKLVRMSAALFAARFGSFCPWLLHRALGCCTVRGDAVDKVSNKGEQSSWARNLRCTPACLCLLGRRLWQPGSGQLATALHLCAHAFCSTSAATSLTAL